MASEQPSERPSDIRELHAKLHRITAPECASCGANDWISPTDLPSLVPKTEPDGTFKGRGVEAVVSICDRCGFIRMHSAQVLRRVKEGATNGG